MLLGVVSTAAVVLGTLPAAVLPAQAAATAVTSASFGVVAVTARGLVPAQIPVAVHLVSGTAGTAYAAVVEDTAGTGRAVGVGLRLAEGTLADGLWTATVVIAADWSGRFALTTVTAAHGGDDDYLAVPDPRPEVVVTGTHVPRLVVTQQPDPVGVDAPVTLGGRLVDTATGRGLAGVPVRHAVDCAPVTCPASSVRTDARGWFTVPYRRVRVAGALVAPQRMMHTFAVRVGTQSDGIPVFVAMRHVLVRVRVSLTAAPARAVVATGSPMTVTGRVVGSPFGALRGVLFPSPRCSVVLERLRGSSSWRAVGSAGIRSTGRYTVAAPAARARHSYRVRAPACGPQQPAVSPRFVVVGS